MSWARELVSIAAGLVLAFGLVDLAKFLLIAAGISYAVSILGHPLLVAPIVAGTIIAVLVGYATVFTVWRLSRGNDIRIGDAVSLSTAAYFDAALSFLTFSYLLAFANLMLGFSLYIYAKEKVSTIKE